MEYCVLANWMSCQSVHPTDKYLSNNKKIPSTFLKRTFFLGQALSVKQTIALYLVDKVWRSAGSLAYLFLSKEGEVEEEPHFWCGAALSDPSADPRVNPGRASVVPMVLFLLCPYPFTSPNRGSYFPTPSAVELYTCKPHLTPAVELCAEPHLTSEDLFFLSDKRKENQKEESINPFLLFLTFVALACVAQYTSSKYDVATPPSMWQKLTTTKKAKSLKGSGRVGGKDKRHWYTYIIISKNRIK